MWFWSGGGAPPCEPPSGTRGGAGGLPAVLWWGGSQESFHFLNWTHVIPPLPLRSHFPLHATAGVGNPRPYRNPGLRQPELHSGTWAWTRHEAANGHPEILPPRVCAAGYRAGERQNQAG